MEPPPAARNRGLGPTLVDSSTLPLAASTAVRTLLSTPFTQTMPALKLGYTSRADCNSLSHGVRGRVDPIERATLCP
jgi:hypothetical protein